MTTEESLTTPGSAQAEARRLLQLLQAADFGTSSNMGGLQAQIAVGMAQAFATLALVEEMRTARDLGSTAPIEPMPGSHVYKIAPDGTQSKYIAGPAGELLPAP